VTFALVGYVTGWSSATPGSSDNDDLRADRATFLGPHSGMLLTALPLVVTRRSGRMKDKKGNLMPTVDDLRKTLRGSQQTR
jgi:hypothetical protein